MKTMMNAVVVLFLFSMNLPVSIAAQAQLKFGQAGTEKLGDVVVSETASLDASGKSLELKRVLSGLRKKQIAFIWPKVYAVQFFTNGTVDRASIEAIRESLIKNVPVVVSMTFVRDVEIQKIVDGYTDVLKKNDIDTKAEPYAKFLAGVASLGEVKNNQTFWFVFSKEKDLEQFSFHTNGKEVFSVNDGKPGTLKNFFSMWLGKTVDSGLDDLQKQFLKN